MSKEFIKERNMIKEDRYVSSGKPLSEFFIGLHQEKFPSMEIHRSDGGGCKLFLHKNWRWYKWELRCYNYGQHAQAHCKDILKACKSIPKDALVNSCELCLEPRKEPLRHEQFCVCRCHQDFFDRRRMKKKVKEYEEEMKAIGRKI